VPKRVVIEITADQVRLTPTGSASPLIERINPTDRDQVWADGLSAIRPLLASLVERAGCANARAIVLAAGPESAVEFCSTPAPPAEARDAALLAVRESASLAPGADPAAVVVLGRDASGEPIQTHTLCAGDRGADALAVVDVVQSAGPRIDAVVPPRAVTMASAAQQALEAPAGAGLIATLRLDDHAAALSAAEDGRILLLRPVDACVQRLVDALTGPIITARGEVSLSEADARDLLMRTGVPGYDAVLDDSTGLRGGDVLPLLQPVLQRLVVEIKQSLRFGLPEGDRARAALRIEGAGAAIPGLPQILTDETELTPDDSPRAPIDWTAERLRVTTSLASTLNLLPPGAVTSRVSNRARTGLLVGLGMAALMLGADAAVTALETHSLKQKIDTLAPLAEQVESSERRFGQATAILATAQAGATRVAEVAPPRAHWASFLAEVSRRTPTSIRVNRIGGAYDDRTPVVTLEGAATADTDEAAREAIGAFVRSLDDCRLVDSATLGGVRRSGEDWAFTIDTRLIGVRRAPQPDGFASAAEEDYGS